MESSSNEITQSVDLCVGWGRLNPNALGWSRKPLIRANLRDHFLRKKKWNYWAVMNQNCFFSATISHIDYVGMVFAYFLDLNSKDFFEETVITPFGAGCDLSETFHESVSFHSKKMSVRFETIHEKVLISVSIPHTSFGRVDAQIKVYFSSQESLTVVVPWSWRRFQLTTKCVGLPCEGTLLVGNRTYEFNVNDSFATFDFGRGVWKYRTFWNWASFSTALENHIIGVNLGAGWTDGTGANENAVFVDGKLIKIDSDVSFDYDRKDLFKPWHIYTKSSDQVELEFHPFFERIAKSNLLIVASSVHQMIGRFKGFVRDAEHNLYIVDGALGWAEEHRARW